MEWGEWDENGQMVLIALLGTLPILVLLLSLVNTHIVVEDKVRRQTTADAAVLSGLAMQARAMNLITAGDVAMTYLLAEAMAGEALLRALDDSISRCDDVIASLEASCLVGSLFGFSGACDLIPIYQEQRTALATARSVISPVLGPICAKPGERGMPAGGLLFIAMKAVEQMNAGVTAATLPSQSAAIEIARANGADGAVLAPLHATLPVIPGHFWHLGEPTRFGSRSPEHGGSPTFRRGYRPILGLPCDQGPLHSCADRYRMAMFLGSLVGGPAIYDDDLDQVYSDWMKIPAGPTRSGHAILDYDRARAHSAGIVMCSYLNAHITTQPIPDATAPPLESLISDETRFRDLAGGTSTASATCAISGASGLVDPAMSAGTRTIRFDWYDPTNDTALGTLHRVRPGLWLVGEPNRETVDESAHTLYRYVYAVVVFQMAYEKDGPDPLDRNIDFDEESRWPDALDVEALPRPYLLKGVHTEEDVAAFRARTYTIGVVWGQPAVLLAPKWFRPSPRTQYAFAQAELYNGTSWDLFTQDWRVRLIPASLLENREDGSSALMGPSGLPAQIQGLTGMPKDAARWLITH